MKASEVLIAAKALLNAHPNAWIKWVGEAPSETGPAYCALGAVQEAIRGQDLREIPRLTRENVIHNSGFGRVSIPYLVPAAYEVAEELGRPLREDVRGDRKGRRGDIGDPAYFNNTANSLDEVNQMFCRAIEKALTDEVVKETPTYED